MLDMLIKKISEPISTSMKSLSLQLELDNIYGNTTSGTYFVDLLCVFSVFCLLCLCVRLFICALWSPAGKGQTFWLSFVV